MSGPFTNILSRDLAATKAFYTGLLGLRVSYESDCSLTLRSPDNPSHELGVWLADDELVPPEFRRNPQGTILSFEVGDVDAVYTLAMARRLTILRPTREYQPGRRGFLTADPNGVLIQVWARGYGLPRRELASASAVSLPAPRQARRR